MADTTLGYRGVLADAMGNPIPFEAVEIGVGKYALAMTARGGQVGAAVGRVEIERPADVAPYAIGDAWADDTAAPTVPSFTAARVDGGTGRITGLRVVCSANQTTRPSLKVLVFDRAYTALEDNAAMDLSDAEAARLVGVFPVISLDWVSTNAGAGANGNIVLQCQVDGACAFECSSDSQELYVAVLLMNAYTPTASETLTLIFDLEQD